MPTVLFPGLRNKLNVEKVIASCKIISFQEAEA